MKKMNDQSGESMKNARRWRQASQAAIAVSALSFLASCAKDAPQDTWQPKGPNAKRARASAAHFLGFGSL